MGNSRHVSTPEAAGSTWRAVAIGLFVSMGGVLFGFDTGLISGILAMDPFKQQFSTGFRDTHNNLDISPSDTSALVSILSAGTFFGALASSFFGDIFGRRWGLFASCCVFNLGVILQAVAEAIPMMLAGRFFAGAGVGLISALVPLYQSETAPSWIRGGIVGVYQWAITIGLLLSAIVNNATKGRTDSGSYRIPISLQALWAVILMIGMLILPETPRYLLKKGKSTAALASLSSLRGLPMDDLNLKQEHALIEARHEADVHIGQQGSYIGCFKGPMRKKMFIGMTAQALQQMSGINFIFYYGTRFFLNSGVSNPFIISMVTSTVNVVSTIPGVLAVDRFGRRPLLIWGSVGQSVSQLAVGLLGTLSTSQDSKGNILVLNLATQKASVAFICIYIFFFASTWGPTTWVMTGEMYPLEYRARALSITTACLWLVNWGIAYSTPYLVDYGDGYANLQSKIFFVWFGATIGMVFFAYFFVYETKGLTLEEVGTMFEEIHSARQSTKWAPSRRSLASAIGDTEKSAVGIEERDVA